MHRRICTWLRSALLLISIVYLGLALLADAQPPQTSPVGRKDSSGGQRFPVLVLTATQGWEHESMRSATELLRRHAEFRGWALTESSNMDEHVASMEALKNFDVVVFLLTSGPIFSEGQKAAFKNYVEDGGSVVAVHSALDTNRDWDWYIGLLGAEFVNHPKVQWAQIRTVDSEHPSTSFLPKVWEAEEEYYNYATPLRLEDMRILLAVNESSYEGGVHGEVHPISWTRNHGSVGSRVWVSALGHSGGTYSSYEWPARYFQRHLALGIEWAANGTSSARRRAKGSKPKLL